MSFFTSFNILCLESKLSDTHKTMPAFLCLLFVWCVFSILNLPCSLYLKCISIEGMSLILAFIPVKNLLLLIEVLSTFTFDVTMNQLRVKSAILPFRFHLSRLLFFFFFVGHVLHSFRFTTYFRNRFYFLYWVFSETLCVCVCVWLIQG